MLKKNSYINNKDISLTLEQAKKQCFVFSNKDLSEQTINIHSALNRVLSADIIASVNVPSHSNSAMDGYALKQSDLENTSSFEVIATSYAGTPFNKKIANGQCVKIMTGGLIPDGTDMVVPQEFIIKQDNKITVHKYQGGKNIRLPGEDLAKGKAVIKKGRLLNAADLGLLASLGIAKIKVWRKLRVAFFSTGDELCSITKQLSHGQIYDSNRYSLYALLSNLHVDLLDMGVVKDNPTELKKAFLAAANCADIIITTGGVSVGEADFVKQVLNNIGKINFWKLAIKPGRPLTFGTINEAHFFGLPGNPVAVMITFYQIVQPFIKKIMGQTDNINPLLVNATTASDIKKTVGRREFVRATLHSDNGNLSVKALKKQGSGVLSSMSKANCLIVLSEEMGVVKTGDVVSVQPFYGLL